MKRKWITRADLFLLAGVLVCVLSLFALFGRKEAGDTVSVYVGNELLAELSLSDAQESYSVSSKNGTLTLCFDGEGVSVLHSDCPDGVCVRTGRISRLGESIVCAPLGICVTVEGGGLDGVTG